MNHIRQSLVLGSGLPGTSVTIFTTLEYPYHTWICIQWMMSDYCTCVTTAHLTYHTAPLFPTTAPYFVFSKSMLTVVVNITVWILIWTNIKQPVTERKIWNSIKHGKVSKNHHQCNTRTHILYALRSHEKSLHYGIKKTLKTSNQMKNIQCTVFLLR